MSLSTISFPCDSSLRRSLSLGADHYPEGPPHSSMPFLRADTPVHWSYQALSPKKRPDGGISLEPIRIGPDRHAVSFYFISFACVPSRSVLGQM